MLFATLKRMDMLPGQSTSAEQTSADVDVDMAMDSQSQHRTPHPERSGFHFAAHRVDLRMFVLRRTSWSWVVSHHQRRHSLADRAVLVLYRSFLLLPTSCWCEGSDVCFPLTLMAWLSRSSLWWYTAEIVCGVAVPSVVWWHCGPSTLRREGPSQGSTFS